MSRPLEQPEHVYHVSLDRRANDFWYTATVTQDGRVWEGYAHSPRQATRIALRARKRQLKHERKRHTAVPS